MTDDSDLWTEQRAENDAYGPGTPCSQCGESLDEYCPEWTEYCYRHVGLRPNTILKDLEVLADELIDGGDYPTDARVDYPYRTGVGRGKNRAGIKIKKLIAEYRSDSDGRDN